MPSDAKASTPPTGIVTSMLPLASIIQDVENGEPLISLRELSNQPYIPRKNGKRPHPSRWFRWAASGLRGVKLEVINAPSLHTTRSSVLRFYQRLSAGPTVPAMTSSSVRQQRHRTDADLDAAGIR